MFRDRYNSKQQELFRILVAYSVYNTVSLILIHVTLTHLVLLKEIGYTQGMSQIAALLLMYTANEEVSFLIVS